MSAIDMQPARAEAKDALCDTFSPNASGFRVVTNVLFGYLSTATGMLAGLVVTPILVRCLGPEQFGLWVGLGSLAGYAGLLELGLTAAVTKRVAASGGVGDLRRLERVVSTAIVLYCAVAFLQVVAVAIVTWLVPHIYRIPSASIPAARVCLVFLGLGAAVSYAGAVYGIAVVGSGRAHVTSVVTGFQFVVVGVLNCLAVALGQGVVWLGAISFAAALANTAACLWLARRIIPSVRMSFRAVSMSMAWEIIRYGFRNATVSICGTVAYGADALVIGVLLPISNVAHYAIAARLVQAVRSVADKPLTTIMPSYSHWDARGEHPKQFRVLVESTKWSIILALPPVIMFCAIGGRIIHAWVGDGHDASSAILTVLSIVMLTEIPGGASYSILTATERSAPLFWTMLVVAPLNLVLSVVFIRAYGPIGAALGSLVTSVGSNLVVLPVLACRQMSFKFIDYARGVLAPLPLPCALMVSLAFLARRLPAAGVLITSIEVGVIPVVGWATFLCCGGVDVALLRRVGHRLAPLATFVRGDRLGRTSTAIPDWSRDDAA